MKGWRPSACPGEFGFVMIGAALAGGLVDRTLATTLISAVALSMLLIPGLASSGGHRFGAASGRGRSAAGDPPESEEPRVVIVGYGRVGVLIGDMLDRHKIPFIALDLDARLAARAKTDGKPVYYGDAARPEIPAPLRPRDGARRCRHHGFARRQGAVVETTRRLRPDVTLVARERHAGHARALYRLGATDAVPETIEASLQLSEAVLVDIGVPMVLVIASIREKRDAFRKILAAAGAPDRPRSTRGPRRG